jgi:hypothetical protein
MPTGKWSASRSCPFTPEEDYPVNMDRYNYKYRKDYRKSEFSMILFSIARHVINLLQIITYSEVIDTFPNVPAQLKQFCYLPYYLTCFYELSSGKSVELTSRL